MLLGAINHGDQSWAEEFADLTDTDLESYLAESKKATQENEHFNQVNQN